MTARAATRAYDDALASFDLSAMQYAIIANISRYEPIQQVTLADHLELERTTLYRAVDILERRDLVRRQEGAVGTERLLKLTRAGKRLLTKAYPAWEAAQSAFIEGFGRQQWRELFKLLAVARGEFKRLPKNST